MYKKDIGRTIPIEGKRLTRKYDYTIKNTSYTPTKKDNLAVYYYASHMVANSGHSFIFTEEDVYAIQK